MCNVLNCSIFSINRISFAEKHSLLRSTKFEPISFLIEEKITIYGNFYGCCCKCKYFYQIIYILGNYFETNYNKNSFYYTPNQSLFKNAEQHLYYLKFPEINYYLNTGMLLTNAPKSNYAII